MGIFSRISNSISTIRDIERKIEAHKEIVKKDHEREGRELEFINSNSHRVRGSIAFRTRKVVDADIQETRDRVQNLDFEYLKSRA